MSSSTNLEKSKPERERQDWGIVLFILLMGFLCVIVAAQWALRFSPTWTLNADMGSNLDLNREFLTSKPVVFFEPVDPAILTQPSWMGGFLTPGASYSTGTPLPAAIRTNTAPPTALGATLIPTNTIPVTYTSTAVPTNTLVWLPLPATPTRRPPNTSVPPTNASPVTLPGADLQIGLSSSTTWYAPGTAFTYTIVVSNMLPGSSAVTGVIVTDTFPTQVSLAGTTWSCLAAGGATCTNGTGNLSDVVSLPFNSSVTYTVTVAFNAGASGALVNSASVTGASYTESNPADNIASLTVSPGVDLRITKTDSAGSYTPGNPIQYIVTVTNPSTFTVNGVTVSDVFSGQIAPLSLSWNCPLCPSSGIGNINDTINMPPGSSVTYTIDGTIEGLAMGPLTNTARVTTPAGFTELNTADNIATDTDAGPLGVGNINIGGPNNLWTTLGVPDSITIVIPPIVANGDGAYDFVFYERLVPAPPSPAHVELDWVQIEISQDGVTWHNVFDFSGGPEDPNTIVNGLCPGEADNCFILPGDLYNSTGVAIDIDSIVPGGNYSWVRITSPAGGDGDGSDVDAIEVLP